MRGGPFARWRSPLLRAGLGGALAFLGAQACKSRTDPAAAKPAPASPASAAPDPSAPVPVHEVEPNDFSHAQPVPARAAISGALTPPRGGGADEDWYRLTPGPGTLLALRVELAVRAPEPDGRRPLEVALEVVDRDRNRLAFVRAREGEPAVLPAVACRESCAVGVSGKTTAVYTLTLLGAPPSGESELEPNDRAVDATELVLGKPIAGTTGSPDDEDWYRLALPPGAAGSLRIEISGVAGVRPELEIRALGDATPLATLHASAPGEGLVVRDLGLDVPAPRLVEASPRAPEPAPSGASELDGGAAAAPPSTQDPAPPPPGALALPQAATLPDAGPALPPGSGYYLVVRPGVISGGGRKGKAMRGFNARVPYALTATLEPAPADLELEPNDDPAHANLLSSSGTRSGYLAPAGDVDWFRVHADRPSVLHVEVTGLERADLELSVYGPPEQTGERPRLLASINEGGPKEGELLPAVGVPAGDSYLKLEAAARVIEGHRVRDGEDPDHLYHLTATLVPEDGSQEREPNDDVAHAQLIPVPARVRGFLWPKKDVDVFRFQVPAGHAPLHFKVSAVRGLDLRLRLFEIPASGGEAEVIGAVDAIHGEGEERLLAVPLKPGEYAVEVSSPRPKDASATQPYTLTVE